MGLSRLTLWLALATLPGWSAAQTWQLEYDAAGGVLPSAEGWFHVVTDPPPADGLNEGNYLVALGALTQGNTGGPNADAANRQRYEIAATEFDFDADVIVVDARLRILASTLTAPGNFNPRAGFAVSLVDKDRSNLILYVGATGLFLRGGGPTTSSLVSFDTTAAFVDYRLRIDRHGASLRVNGAEVATFERDSFWVDGSASVDRVIFGDLSTGHSSSSQLERLSVVRFEPPPAEVRDYQVVTLYSANDSSGTKSLTVPCPAGSNALSGGVSAIGADGSVGVRDSRPQGAPLATAWYGAARELVDTSADWQLRVDAICGEVTGYEAVVSDGPLSTDPVPFGSLTCSPEKTTFSGGGGIIGAGLRQSLIASGIRALFGEPYEWVSAARDFGAGATSAGAWGVRVATICSDAPGFEIVSSASAADATSSKQAVVNCPTGKVPIGGGARIIGHQNLDAALRFSRPRDGAPGAPPVGWIAEGQAIASLWSIEVEAVCAPIADPTVSKNGLVGRWEGEYGAYDSWGIRHGSLENGVGFAPGILGQAFEFVPPLPEVLAKPWVRIPSVYPGEIYRTVGPRYLYPETSFTTDAWIVTDTLQPADFPAVVNLYDYGGIGANANCSTWQITLTAEGFLVGSARSAAQVQCVSAVGTGSTNVADGLPHHVAVSRDTDTRKLSVYLDGALEVQTTLTTDATDGPLFPATAEGDPVAIGVWREAQTANLIRPFDGLIDDVKYYDRALTLEEIQEIAGCALPIVPRVLNLDASRFGRKPGANGGLCVFLEAGTYSLTLVNPSLAAAARLTAWSPSAAAPWSTVYVADGEIDGETVGGYPTGSATPVEAFDDTLTLETFLSLDADQRVYFSVLDQAALDNRGGVSIRVLPVLPDTDGDGTADQADNCRFRANPSQADANANGAGDACECGDVDGPASQPDGLVDAFDAPALRDHLAAILELPPPVREKCSVVLGDADGCEIDDWARIVRLVAGDPPLLEQGCRAAVGGP